MMNATLTIAIAAFAVTLPLMFLAIAFGRRAGLVDHPGPIKPHVRPIPHTGGAAILIGVAGVGLIAGVPLSVLIGLALMCLVGLVDDARGLDAPVKLVAEIPPLALSLTAVELEPAAAVIALVSGLVLVNAFNVIDGLDGLAGGAALPVLLVMTAVPGWSGALAAATAGAVVAFLCLNLPPARVFLGDEGSLVLGQVLWLTPLVALKGGGASVLPIWVLLWAFPIVNAAFVVFVRMRERRSVLRGDRSHLYDALHRRFGLMRSLLICWSIAALGVIGALAFG